MRPLIYNIDTPYMLNVLQFILPLLRDSVDKDRLFKWVNVNKTYTSKIIGAYEVMPMIYDISVDEFIDQYVKAAARKLSGRVNHELREGKLKGSISIMGIDIPYPGGIKPIIETHKGIIASIYRNYDIVNNEDKIVLRVYMLGLFEMK